MKKSIKVLAVLATVLMTTGLFSGCIKEKTDSEVEGTTNEKGDIKLGAVLPLTGDVATFGESSKNALTLLQEQVNAKGGVLDRKIQFVFEDDENKPAKAPDAVQKLIDKDEVVGIVGSVSSKCTIAAGPVATKNKIPLVSGTATSTKVTLDGGNFVFRACFIDPFQGTVLAKFAVEDLKGKSAAMLYDIGNDYCTGLAESFKKEFEKSGGKIVASETYNAGDKDFNAQLTKIKNLKPDVILLPDYYSTVGLIVKQARAAGIEATFLGGDGWDSADLTSIAGDSINGGYFSNHYSPDDTAQEVVDFKKAYADKYGADKTPDALAALAYDAGKLLIAAIEKAGTTDGQKVRDALAGIETTVVSGKITFDKDRNPIKGAVIIKVEDGKMKFVKKVNP